jgi:hypothetical protein
MAISCLAHEEGACHALPAMTIELKKMSSDLFARGAKDADIR